jgi:tetratricopeptide (TPR) repeat protein
MTANARAVGVVVALAITCLGAALASANPPDPPRPGRALFERAEANFNRGKFEEARADYQAAYDIEPLPAFLFNIGQCYRNMGDYDRALFFFQRYTQLDPDNPNRPAAERLIAEMTRLAEERRAQAGPGASHGAAPVSSAVSPAPPGQDGGRPTLEQTGSPPERRRAFYRRPWFWAGVGGAIVLGVAAAFALSNNDPHGTLPPIDVR